VLGADRFIPLRRPAETIMTGRPGSILLLLLTMVVFHWQLVTGNARVPFDFEGYHYPLLYQIFRNLQLGVLPLWDNSSYGGLPFVHNVNAATYYPVHLAFLGTLVLLGIDFTLRLMQFLAVFHYFIASLGMFLLLEELKFRRPTALLGGILFACNGFLLAQSQHLGLVETISWIPFAFLLLKRGIDTGRWLFFLLLGVLLAVMLLIGFLPEFLGFLIVLGLYAVWLIFNSSRPKLRSLGLFAGSSALAVGLSAIVLLPMLEYTRYSPELDRHGGTPTTPLITALIPDFFGSSSLQTYWGSIDPTVNYFYAGLLVLVFLPFGLLTRRKELRFFQILLPLSFLLAFAPTADYIRPFFQALPLIGALFRPLDLMIYVPFSAVILSLAGLEKTSDGRRVPLSSLAWLLVILGLCYYGLAHYRRSVLDEAAFPALILLIVTFLSFALRGAWKAPVLSLLVLELLFLNSGRFFAAFPGDPNAVGRNYVDSTNRELIELFQSDRDVFRIAVDQERMGGPWNSAFRIWGLESVNGFDPLVNKYYLDFLTRNGLTWRTNRTFHLGDLDSDVFRFLNVKYYVTSRDITPPHPDFEKIVDTWYRVYRYRKFTNRYLVLPPIESGKGISANELAAGRAARVVDYRTNSRRIELEAGEGGSSLFLGEVNYTGWKARVDGREAVLEPVNEIFMSLRVPPGHHVVDLAFSPRSFWWGLAISLGTLVVVIVAGLSRVRRRFEEPA